MTAGRPSKFKPEFVEQAAKLCALGATDLDIADFFGICEATLNTWKQVHPEFLESIKDAKSAADERVKRSLFERATGYEHEAVKIHVNASGEITTVPYVERYPPDTTAGIFWLKNRDPANWRDRQDVNLSGGLAVSLASALDALDDSE